MNPRHPSIEIDGSILEGGGQILRTALTYSVLLGLPVRVFNIRANRKPTGLRPQHLKTLEALAFISGAKVDGHSIGSNEVSYFPGKTKGGIFDFNIGNAGSVTLMLQCLAPAASFSDSPSSLRIIGGTNVKWSPPALFMENVIWNALRSMGFQGTLSVLKEGFYPKGGGLIHADIKPIERLAPLKAVHIRNTTVRGVSMCGRLPRHVAERQASSAKSLLKKEGFANVSVRLAFNLKTPLSPGSMICLWTDVKQGMFLGSSALGERGKPAEKVGEEAAWELIKAIRLGASVDKYTSDNMILWCSLSSGISDFIVSELTLHTKTAIELARIFTDAQTRVKMLNDKAARIRIKGIGFKNEYLS